MSNLKSIRDRYKPKKQLATLVGMSDSYVSQLCSGVRPITEDTAREIELKLGMETGSLSKEIGISEISTSTNTDKWAIDNIALAPDLRGDIPLIDYEMAGTWGSNIDTRDELKAAAHYSTTKSHSARTYALRVVGDPMQNSTGQRPTYYDGDVIIVDPDQADNATNTSRVVARLCDETLPMDRRVTFKQLIIDGHQRYLKPLNNNYSPIHDEFEVIGLVINVIAD